MSTTDMPLTDLRNYRPEVAEPEDFDAFWNETLAAAREQATPPTFTPWRDQLATVEVIDVAFSGFGGTTVRGWLMLPRNRSGPLPVVVEYIGYSGGRGVPHNWLTWSAAGYAHFVMDTRGQSSGAGYCADTPDQYAGHAASAPGFMTRGIEDPDLYYFRRVITDAVLAVDAIKQHPDIDAARVVVAGGSQGGGLNLAAAGLRNDLAGALPEVPFLCHYRRSCDIAGDGPYLELVTYLKTHPFLVDQTLRTLSYFDGVNFARRATCPSLFSVALMDPICPPSSVFAAHHAYAGPSEIAIFPYNEHEGGGILFFPRKLDMVREWFGQS